VSHQKRELFPTFQGTAALLVDTTVYDCSQKWKKEKGEGEESLEDMEEGENTSRRVLSELQMHKRLCMLFSVKKGR